MQVKHPEITPGAIIREPGSTKKNKTGGWRANKPKWDSNKCTNCLICWMYCPDAAILVESKKRFETDFDFCKGCGICAEVCPVKCITMVQEQK